jgi:protein-S-isoprenylcysteine O-methyltransferase Ste14
MMISLSRWITLLVSLAFFLIYFKGGTSIVKDVKRSLDTAVGRSYRIVAIFMGLAALIILPTQFLICLGIVEVSSWAEHGSMVIPGAILVIAGIASAFWIRHGYLGRFWSGTVEIQAGHEIMEGGPYGIVRHPIYAVSLVIYWGMALAFAVWWNWIACGTMIAGYLWLASHEDRFLEANLPGYREYQQRIRYKMVPGIW